MSTKADNPGVASDLARQASERTDAIASWLDGKEPAAILDEVTSFARRRPGAFLAIAAGAGLLAGRLTRGLKAQPNSAEPEPAGAEQTSSPSAQTAPAYVPLETPITPSPSSDPTIPLDPPPAAVFPTPGYLGETRR